jgi:TetR/AcrR family transcriptional regulator, copper-responsive repressor
LNRPVRYDIFFDMGRPKKYERGDVLKNAMKLFWKRGFSHTGLQDLEKATSVNKSGLYAEFKGKDDIFVSSLLYYYENRGSGKFLIAEPLGWHNIEKFFKFIAQGWLGEKGCLSINSMRELNILPPEAQKLVSTSRIQLKQIFAKNIAAEQTNLSPDILADIAATFFSGFCLEQNIKTSKAATARRIEEFMQAVRNM